MFFYIDDEILELIKKANDLAILNSIESQKYWEKAMRLLFRG